MLTTLDACEKKFYYEYILKLSPLAISPDLHAGGAFSLGCEIVRHFYYVEQAPLEECLVRGSRAMMEYWGNFEPPHGHPKTCEAMIGALHYYFEVAFPIATDHIKPHMLPGGGAAVEFSFSIPTEVSHPISGDPIIFAGRFDMLGLYQNALLCIVDDKTTKALGERWRKQWALRGQFLGYTFAAHQHDLPVELCIIRGISILKTSYGHLEAIEQFPRWQIARWWEQANEKISRAKEKFLSGEWGYSYGEACSAWGQCTYMSMCQSADPSSLFSNFQERTWNPLNKNPTAPKGGVKDISYENVGNIHDSNSE